MKQVGQFIKELGAYIAYRFRQIFFFAYAGIEVFIGVFSQIKSYIVSRMFWGRGSFYRTSFHLFISVLSVSILISGISSKLNIFGAQASGLGLTSGTVGQDDIFSQSGTSESLVLNQGTGVDDEYDYIVYKHEVSSGESLSSIAALYGINVKTLMWANGITNQNASLQVGQVLKAPQIDGVFYSVKNGDTLAKIAKTVKSDAQTILDFNTKVLDIENPVLTAGMELFIPGGQVVVPTQAPIIAARPPQNIQILNLPSGTFVNPLINCPGYTFIRGFFPPPGHKGVDMAKYGGCIESAAADGVVTQAGWGSQGEGWHVVIEHGNGFKTRYYHGSGKFYVKIGDHVRAGQPIMYMGSSGQSTGTHLHFELALNNIRINPELYIKLR